MDMNQAIAAPRPNTLFSRWAPIPLRLIVGFGFMQHGFAKLGRGPEHFAAILQSLGTPAPHLMGWISILTELLGGLAIFLGAFVPFAAIPMAIILVVAIFTVHLRFGFSSIKLLAVTAAGPQLGLPATRPISSISPASRPSSWAAPALSPSTNSGPRQSYVLKSIDHSLGVPDMSRVLIIESRIGVSREIGEALADVDMPFEYSGGHVDALRRLRAQAFGVVITNAYNAIDEGLAFLEEIRTIRPSIKCIVLAHRSTPDEVIAALRARVFAFFSPPFDAHEIASLAMRAAADNEWLNDIEIVSARPGWVSLRVNSRLITAERLMSFAKELSHQLSDNAKHEVLQALREILLNAMEHGAAFNPDQFVDVTAIRTARTMTFRVRDPGAGFRRDAITHAVSTEPSSDPTAHIAQREEQGIRAGGYGLLLAAGTVDELIYNELGNEVLLIKYLDNPAPASAAKKPD
jgi:uncharacterized membrane protein YphA (DoxX/SURF4 family)/DNA-binding NarL/FixJ family response regulator